MSARRPDAAAVPGRVLISEAELPAFMAEAAPPNRRGLYLSMQYATQDAAILVAGLVGTTLAAHLATVQSRALAAAVGGSETAIDSATEERLRALGYVN